MAMVPLDDPRERFRVVVWTDGNASEQPTAYQSLSEAQDSFDKLRAGKAFYYGELLKWVDHDSPWELLDSWEHGLSEKQETSQ